MSDLDSYRLFIDRTAALGYALLFRKVGDFGQAQSALENALLRGYSSWLLERPAPRDPAAFMARLIGSPGAAPEAPSLDRPTGLLATSQKLRALEDAIDRLRSLSDDDQAALVLLHVEEVPPDQVLRWLEKTPEYLVGLEVRLKEKVVSRTPQGPTHEEPMAFFLRTLRQNRLPSQFSELVVQRLGKGSQGVRFPTGLVEGLLVIGIPLFLLPRVTEHFGYDPYDYGSPWSLQASVLAQQVAIDLIVAISALLVGRYVQKHAPPDLAGEFGPGMATLLRLAAMAGFGLILSSTPTLLQAGSHRSWGGPAWFLLRELWHGIAIPLVLLGLYRIAVYALRKIEARTAPGPGGKP